MENNCLFCLESNCKIIKKSVCECKIYAHELCWEKYEMRKGIIECPICHLKTDINPLEFAAKHHLREKVIVELQSHNQRDNDNGFQKGCIVCCLGYFCACTILSAVFG